MTHSRPVFSRRSGLLAAGGLLLAGCTSVPNLPAPTASPTGSVRDQLQAALTAISAGTDRLGVALEDLRTGATWDFRGGYAGQSASMAKPMIVSMALRKALNLEEAAAMTYRLLMAGDATTDFPQEWKGNIISI